MSSVESTCTRQIPIELTLPQHAAGQSISQCYSWQLRLLLVFCSIEFGILIGVSHSVRLGCACLAGSLFGGSQDFQKGVGVPLHSVPNSDARGSPRRFFLLGFYLAVLFGITDVGIGFRTMKLAAMPQMYQALVVLRGR